MTAEPDQFRAVKLPGWCKPLLLVVALGALTVLFAGWGAGIDAVVRIWPRFATMAPSTAVLFAAISLVLLSPPNGASRARILRVVALVSLTVALINLAVMVTGIASGIDALFLSALGIHGLVEHGMAVATALCFSLLAISLLTITGNSRWWPVFVSTATGGLLLSLIALVGYIFDAEALHTVSLFTAMALHTAVFFVILFVVVLFARPDRGWVLTLVGPGEGSAGARRLMPLVIGTPLLFCVLVLLGRQADLFDANFGLSLLAILIIALLSISVLRNAQIQNTMQKQLTMRLQQLTADNEVLLQEVYHRVKNNLQQINALIMLEARSLPEVQRGALLSLSNRILSLARVYEQLLSSQSLSTLNLSQFLEDLCSGILRGSGADQRNIQCHCEAEDLPVKVDSAIFIGLLVNELVTNALKHAFTGREKGTIHVSLHTADDQTLRLIVQDDGRGIQEGEAGDRRTAGSRIVRGLIRQLEGSMRVSTGQGTLVEVTIPGDALE